MAKSLKDILEDAAAWPDWAQKALARFALELDHVVRKRRATGRESVNTGDASARKGREIAGDESHIEDLHGGQGENRHPMFGAMKGLVHVTPGTDLTEPADPEWGKVWDEAK